MKQQQQGFTLIELMIVIAIIGILAAIAVPNYSAYVDRSRYTEVIMATAPYKTGVELCIQLTGDRNSCNAGGNNIPDDISGAAVASNAIVSTLTVVDGTIQVIPQERGGIEAADTYTLVPQINDATGQVTWQVDCANQDLCTSN